MQRIFARDSNLSEKSAALGVASAMAVKRELGMGLARCVKITKALTGLAEIIKVAKKSMKPGRTAKLVIASALEGARSPVKKYGEKTR